MTVCNKKLLFWQKRNNKFKEAKNENLNWHK